MTATPKKLPPKWFYDERGSELFEEITRQPEYYLTRREREILRARAGENRRAHARRDPRRARLGQRREDAASCSTRSATAGSLRRFVPFDVCLPAVVAAGDGARGASIRPSTCRGVVGDFHQHVGFLPRAPVGAGRGWWRFSAARSATSTPTERGRFFRGAASRPSPGDFLLGADLVKAKARLDAAYNDAAGVTVCFNKNVLRVLNRDLDATFDEERFEHVAATIRDRELIDIRLRARVAHEVEVRALGLDVAFRRRRGDAHRDQREVHPRRPRRACSARPVFRASGFWTDRAREFSCRSGRSPDRFGYGAALSVKLSGRPDTNHLK